MKNEFINTDNVTSFFHLCEDLEDPSSLIGPSLAMVSGPAGRGKSEAAKHYSAKKSAIYIPPLNTRTPTMLLREIAFELCKVRPTRSEECLAVISGEMMKERRLTIIDEADLLPMQILEMLRNLNEMYSFPILLIGEDKLAGKIGSRRRLSSRIRRKLEFEPVTQPDVINFFKKAMGVKLSSDACEVIHRMSGGDWRPILVKALAIERAMKASNLTEVTVELAKEAQ